MQRWSKSTVTRVSLVVALVLSGFASFMPTTAHAAAFTQAFLRLNDMSTSTATGGTVCATPVTGVGVAQVVITFPATYTVNATAGHWTVTTTNLPPLYGTGGTAATAWPGIGTATSVSGQTVTFPSSALTAATYYCFNFKGTTPDPVTLTTASAAASSQQASIETQTGGSVQIDHTDIALANIANDTIVVSAVVPPTFIFTLSGNTDNFGGNLDPASVKSSAGKTVTVTTNAKGGWIAWAKDTQQGLHSANAAYTIPSTGTLGSVAALSAGTEGYVLDTRLTTTTLGCTLAIDAGYAGNGTTSGGLFSANYQPIANCTGTVPATSNGAVITLMEHVAISGATPAANDYTDTITVVGAGNF